MSADGSINLPGSKETIEQTEEFDCDVTTELTFPDGAAGSAQSPPLQATPAGPAIAVSAGSVLSERYLLDQPLGNGGTSLISRARDLWREEADGGDPYVAIKRLRPELRDRPGSIARLRREFQQTRSLEHPNIVRFYDFDCDRGTWFIAMECLSGEALGQRLRRAQHTGLPPQEAFHIATACGAALGFAHAQGVTHGDVKPDNVFVTAGNEVRVLDFGVASGASERALAGQGSADRVAPAATRAYASPEVLAGQSPEPRDDVFSLTCMIYEMLSGCHPYGRRGANSARDEGVVIKPLRGLSRSQWRTLAAGLAWRREQRPADVRALLRALGTGVPVATAVRPMTRVPIFDHRRSRHRRPGQAWRGAVAIAGAAVLGVLSGAVGFGSSSSGAQSTSPAAPPSTMTALAASSAPGDAAANTIPAPATSTVVAESRRPVRAGRLSFESATMIVSHRAVAAAIPVRRLDQPGQPLRAAWRVTDGTAIAGRDFGSQVTGVIQFAEGQTVRIIYVPLLAGAGAAFADDRSFTIELTGAATRSKPADVHRLVVTIQGEN